MNRQVSKVYVKMNDIVCNQGEGLTIVVIIRETQAGGDCRAELERKSEKALGSEWSSTQGSQGLTGMSQGCPGESNTLR